jgi:DNA helicase-2/ATP-dependent DNA helicase PcrA
MLDSEMSRLVFSLLRLLKDPKDYVAHRTILGLQNGVGAGTCANIARKVVSANLNFRDLFYVPYPSGVFSTREDGAIQRAAAINNQVSSWNGLDTLQTRMSEIATIVSSTFNATQRQSGQAALAEWQVLVALLPPGMNLEELLSYLWSDTEAGQLQILDAVAVRLGLTRSSAASGGGQPRVAQRIRILTIHGAKGLDGRIVFIPGLEQGILPNPRAFQAAGLLHEQRRLLYVSITRAKAACILTLARTRVGYQAFALVNKSSVQQVPSLFLTDIGLPPQNRTAGLTTGEVATIMTDCANL